MLFSDLVPRGQASFAFRANLHNQYAADDPLPAVRASAELGGSDNHGNKAEKCRDYRNYVFF